MRYAQAVQKSASLLRDAVGLYVYISSISAYRDFADEGNTEGAPLEPIGADPVERVTHENYGALKARCEGILQYILPGRVLIVRPGLIAGPHDPTDRFTYWVRRLHKGGRVLAPGAPRNGPCKSSTSGTSPSGWWS